PGGPAPGARGPAGLLQQVLPQGLHAAPAVRHPGAEDVLQDRLPRRHPAAGGLRRTPRGAGPGRGAALLDPLLRRQAAVKKGESALRLSRPPAPARAAGLLGGRPPAAVDATGRESRHTSRYFFRRAGRRHSSRLWTKLTVVCDAGSHFLAAATVTLGPANDS